MLMQVFHRVNPFNEFSKVKKVALVNVNFNRDENKMLEETFRLTNTIDSDWKHNRWVFPTKHAGRSTMTGDVIQFRDRAFRVKANGFEEVNSLEQ